MKKTIYVYDGWLENSPIQIGKLFVEDIKGKENYSFEYDPDWLNNYSMSVILDPDIKLFTGRQYSTVPNKMFGVFSDSCPDRWGRLLMKRNEDINARIEKRTPRKLSESDYLLGVNDETRMGALRFSLDEGGEFVSNDPILIPPLCNLRELENAYREYESGKNPELWLKQLMSPGSSLGGARPKANVKDADGTLWIAKFPAKNDEIDVGAWEIVVHDLAKLCGIDVPEARAEKLSKYGTTYLVKRFDRDNGKRLHYASALALLGKEDGNSETSYLEILQFILTSSSRVTRDSIELWKRIVFYMLVSNTDDHLRNHGFILDKLGWKLSPMFDVNPNMDGTALSLNVDDNSGRLDLDLIVGVSEYFGIKEGNAKDIISRMQDTIKHSWKFKAKQYGISSSEISLMEKCFALTEKNIK